MEQPDVVAAAPETAAEPRRERGAGRRPPRHATPDAQPEFAARAERPRREDRRPRQQEQAPAPVFEAPRGRGRYQDDLGPPVMGLGDHMPAFMMRPVVIKRAAPKEKSVAEE